MKLNKLTTVEKKKETNFTYKWCFVQKINLLSGLYWILEISVIKESVKSTDNPDLSCLKGKIYNQCSDCLPDKPTHIAEKLQITLKTHDDG